MNTRNLQIFLTVAKEGAFSKAARLLFISPSAVLQTINLLEEKYQVKFFQRNTHGVKLTQAGEIMVNQAQKMLEIENETQKLLRKYQKVMIAGSFFPLLFEKYWPPFASKHPEVKIKFKSINSLDEISPDIEIFEGMPSADILKNGNFSFLPLLQVPLAIAVPPHSRLASKKIIASSDLNYQTIVAVGKAYSHASGQAIDFLKNHMSHLQIIETQPYTFQNINQFEVRQEPLLIPENMDYYCRPYVTRKLEKKFTVPYGIFYRRNQSAASESFIKYVRKAITKPARH